MIDHENAQQADMMQPIEELRYLILAAQREGNRLLAEALRPLRLTPSQAAKVAALEAQFYEAIAGLVKDASLPEILEVLWRFVEGKPAGMALARRVGRETEGETLAL
jgi:hypothetical protein